MTARAFSQVDLSVCVHRLEEKALEYQEHAAEEVAILETKLCTSQNQIETLQEELMTRSTALHDLRKEQEEAASSHARLVGVL